MALIKCKECGHEVSDKASVCPNCGCPIKKGTNHVSNKPVMNSKTKSWFLLFLLLCFIIGGGYYAFNKLFNGGNGKDAIVELTPKFISAIQRYEKLGSFSEGLAAVMRDGKWGYINTKGDEVIPCQYTMSEAFHEGLAAVQKYSEEGYIDTEWGYIDTEGKEVIPLSIEAEKVNEFYEGLATIIKNYFNFSVIDTKGNVVFSGKCDFEQYGEDGFSYMQLHYNQGLLCVPLAPDKFAVYDKQGHKTKEINQEAKDEIDKQDVKPYIVFAKENGDSEDNWYNTVGLKDTKGKEIIHPVYDGIGNVGLGERIDASNGVLLVVLDEIGEDVIDGYGGEFDSPDTKHHYGYVDLKGNDTFSNELKERCQDSKELAAVKLQLIKEGPDWMQGAWRTELTDDYGTHMGYMYEVFNHGISKTYIDGSFIMERDYTVSDDMVMYDKGHYQLDANRHLVISANGQEMKKVSDNPNYTPTSTSTQSSSRSTTNRSSSSGKGYRFSSPQDVIGWLADKSFYNGSRRLRIRPDGVWLNDYCATFAPQVERWESWKALIRATTATGSRLSFFVDPVNGTITDEANDVFRLR